MTSPFVVRRFMFATDLEVSSRICRKCRATLITESAGDLTLLVCTNDGCARVYVDESDAREALGRALPGDASTSFWPTEGADADWVLLDLWQQADPANRPVQFLWDWSDANGRLDMVEFLLLQDDAKVLAWVFQNLSDDDYCSFLDSVEAGGTNAFTTFSRELLSRCFPEGQYAAHERQALWRWLAGALAIAAGNEFARRIASNETRIGEVMRRWAGRGPSGLTQEELQTVTKKAVRNRYHPDGPEEARAAFAEALVEKMAEKMRTFFSSSLGQQMRMCLRGDLERVPSQADNVVREEARRLVARPDQPARDSFPVEIRVEQAIHEHLLLGEVLAAADPRERKVLELDVEGWKQEEIAAQLAISQPRVSQIKGKAKKKIRRALKTLNP